MPLTDLELCCRCRNRTLLLIATPTSAHPDEGVLITADGAVGDVTWGALTLGPQGALTGQGGNSAVYMVSKDCPCSPYSVTISACDECCTWVFGQTGQQQTTADTSFMVDHWPFSVTVTPFCDGASEAFSLTVEGGCPPWLVQKYTTGTGWVDYTTIQEGAGPFTLGSYVAPSCSITYRVRGANCPNDSDRHWQQFTLTPTSLCYTCSTPDRPETVTIGGGPDGGRATMGQSFGYTLTGAETYTGRVVWSVNNAGCSISGNATGATLTVGSTACDYNSGQITITVEVGPECCDITDTESAQAGTWVVLSSCSIPSGCSIPSSCAMYPANCTYNESAGAYTEGLYSLSLGYGGFVCFMSNANSGDPASCQVCQDTIPAAAQPYYDAIMAARNCTNPVCYAGSNCCCHIPPPGCGSPCYCGGCSGYGGWKSWSWSHWECP